MALRAAAHTIIVTPTGDNHERRIGNLFVANDAHAQKIFRGVCESVGEHVVDGIEVGNLALYSAYVELDDETIGVKHIVPSQHLLAFDA